MRLTTTSAVLIMLVAGCGGSSKTTTSAATNTPTTAASSASASGSTSAAAPSFASATNCRQLAGLGAKYAQALSASTSGGGKFDLQSAASAFQALANAAPSQIRSDLQLAGQTFSSFAAELTKAGYTPGKAPTAAQLASLQTAIQVFKQPKFRAAEQRISAWAHQNCG